VGNHLSVVFGGSRDCDPDEIVSNEDGSLTVRFREPAGTYNYFVSPVSEDYGSAHGSVTVTTLKLTQEDVVLPLRAEQEAAMLNIRLVTADGSPVPDGAEVCALALSGQSPEDSCRPWWGQPEQFELPPTEVTLAAQPGTDGEPFDP